MLCFALHRRLVPLLLKFRGFCYKVWDNENFFSCGVKVVPLPGVNSRPVIQDGYLGNPTKLRRRSAVDGIRGGSADVAYDANLMYPRAPVSCNLFPCGFRYGGFPFSNWRELVVGGNCGYMGRRWKWWNCGTAERRGEAVRRSGPSSVDGGWTTPSLQIMANYC